jgi:activator of 2-hydroxyglutaryl-CoA dehydratase
MNEIRKKIISTICCLSLCCCGVLADIDSSGKKMQDEDEELYLGIDIGGQSVKMAVYAADGTKIEEGRPIPTNKKTKPKLCAKLIAKEASKIEKFL